MSDTGVILTVIVLYLAALVAIGLWSARHARGRSAFFLAGRQLGTIGTTATLSATVIGGSATIVAVIHVFYNGLAMMWFAVAGGLGLLVLSMTLAPKVRALGAFTLPDIAGRLFDGRVRAATSVMVLLAEIAWVSLLIQACMVISYMFTDIEPELTLAAFTGIFIAYTLVGGQRAVAMSDVMQLGLMVVGFCFILMPLAVMEAGGYGGLANSGMTAWPVSEGVTPLIAVSLLLTMGLSHVVGPDVYSKLLSARDDKTAKRSAFFAGVIGVCFGLTVTLIGLSAFVIYDGSVAVPAMIMPMLMMDLMPPAVAGLMAAALLAAFMSSADSLLLTAGTVFAHDIYAPVARRRRGEASKAKGRSDEMEAMEERREVMVSKAALVAVGVLAFFLALKFQDIIDTLQFAYTVFSAGVILPIIAGFYKERTRLNPMGAIGGIILGGGSALLIVVDEFRDAIGVDIFYKDYAVLIGLGFCVLGMVTFNFLGRGK